MAIVLNAAGPSDHAPAGAGFWKLTLGSVGVVYGDIGTSPLYALKESVKAASAGGAPNAEGIYGSVSLILWALLLVVTLKYVLLILRADNNGEGGTITLMALLQRALGRNVFVVTLLGMASAALFYGDAIITPAISVLSALEGLKVVTPAFQPFVLPASFVILIGLFVVQSRGTAAVAAWFGPITVFWFLVLAAGGVAHIAQNPAVLGAINPMHGVRFLLNNGMVGFVTLGAVFLAVTGAEALYADMGHFGRKPIQAAWSFLVLPSLALNYMGQGAMLLAEPEKLENPFFLMYPSWALLPMIVLATAATIIASQAVITGAYSLSQQAAQLGLLPRLEIRRTSETEAGQIYAPAVNWLLLGAVVLLVSIFQTSDNLASAYGIAVTGTMVITSILIFLVIWRVWGKSPIIAAIIVAPLLAIDLVFLAANALKIPEGGWMPLVVGGWLMIVMLTWRRGTRILGDKMHKQRVALTDFLGMLAKKSPPRVAGTAVFLTGLPDDVPSALLHNLKHNKVLHAVNVILTVEFADTPRVSDEQRAAVEQLPNDFWRVVLRFGFMEEPNVPKALPIIKQHGLKFDAMNTSFFFSRRSLRPAERSKMPRWQDKLFIRLAGSAHDVSRYFHIPTTRAVEVGAQITV